MAEVMMSKTGIFSSSSSSIHVDHQHGHRVSVFPTQSAMVSSGLGFPSLKIGGPLSIGSSSSSNSDFHGRRIEGIIPNKGNTRSSSSINSQMNSGRIGKSQIWWEKGLQPNMREVEGAEDLVESLLSAGDKLVVVAFFSPGCGGCKALHPKICQFAEMNPDVQFLQVNHEEHKSMCYSLNVHVLPFFRFYRGAHGRLCSFSCTNATIKKFRDALAKHSTDRSSLGPAKGLEEKELLALAANKDLSFTFTPEPQQSTPKPDETPPEGEQPDETPPEGEKPVSLPLPLPVPLPTTCVNATQDALDKTLVTSGR